MISFCTAARQAVGELDSDLGWELPGEFSPLIYKDELAVDGVPGHVFRGLHADLAVGRLWNHMGMEPPDGNQAAQIAALVIWLVIFIQAHLCWRPAF